VAHLELTWEEISALAAAAREREQMLRIRGAWGADMVTTERIESALAKLRQAYHHSHRDDSSHG